MSRNYKSSSRLDLGSILCILFWVFIGIWIFWRCAHSYSYNTSEEISYTATVTRMEVKEHNSESKYLVFTRLTDTDEVHVFQITDSFFHGALILQIYMAPLKKEKLISSMYMAIELRNLANMKIFYQ